MNNRYKNKGLVELDKQPPVRYKTGSQYINKRNVKDNLKNVTTNPLNSAFFSKENIIIIQNSIRHTIWLKSNRQFIIAPQSETEIEIIMRSIYLQYSKNLPTNIREQIRDLNNLVVREAAPNIMSNIKQYLNYKQDLTSGPQFMDHPKNVSSAGSKTLVHNLF